MDSSGTGEQADTSAEVEEFAAKLFSLARAGNVDLLAYIAQGVNVNLLNHEGQSFLMLASYNGHQELTRGLLKAGADVNLLNDRGQSPLAGVIFKREDALVDLLLDAGADPRAGTPSAWEVATMFGRDDLISRFS